MMWNTTDYEFGPAVKGRTEDFDFTLFFEDTFFVIVPSAIFLLIAPFRTVWLWRTSTKVVRDRTRLLKMVALAVFAVMQMIVLVLWAINASWRTRASVPAAALDFTAAMALFLLSHLEHSRAIQPSLIINLYLLITLILDVARLRTAWLLEGTQRIAIVLTISTVVKAGLLVLEATDKRNILLDFYKASPPEATSGILNRSVFWWLNPVFHTGFSKILGLNDLFDLDEDLSSTAVLARFETAWIGANKARKHALFFSCMWAVRWPLFVSAIPRLLVIGFKYAQPYLVSQTVGFVESREGSKNNGYGLIGAFAICYTGLAILTAMYNHLLNRCITMIRGGLVGMIYTKTLALSIPSLTENGSITLMSSDVERICQSLMFFHECWAILIEVGIALYILAAQVGVACVGSAIVATIATVGSLSLGSALGKSQKEWLDATQIRLNFTRQFLGSMRSIKMLGLSSIVSHLTQRLRLDEVDRAKDLRRWNVARISLSNLSSSLTIVLTFGIFVIVAQTSGRTIDTGTAYTSLSVLALIEPPLSIVGFSWPMIIASLLTYDRIQKYLESPERCDRRRMPSEKTTTSTLSAVTNRGHGSNISLQDLDHTAKYPMEDAVTVKDGSFGWKERGRPILHGITVRFKISSTTFIIGPVGSGKSTLLKSLLGETTSSHGFIRSISPEIGFADQEPWIRNGTFKENVLGADVYKKSWYDQVIKCCALDDDLLQLPRGDESAVGSNGISLSGGQRQRLALARAIYSKKGILLLDDVFSGLDLDTEEKVFNRLFGKRGILRELNSTTILVTHAVHRLSYADQIIVLNENGIVSEQGTYRDLCTNNGYVQGLRPEAKEEKDDDKLREDDPGNKVVISEPSSTDSAKANLTRRTGDLDVYRYYFSNAGWITTVSFLCLNLVYVAVIKLPAVLAKLWSDDVAKRGNAANAKWMAIFASLAVIGLCTLGATVFLVLLVMLPRTSRGLHLTLLQTVMAAPLAFFSRTDLGTVLNRFSQDMLIIDAELPNYLLNASFSLCFCIASGALMAVSAAYFTAALPFTLLILYAIQKFYLRTSRQMRLLDLEHKAPLYSQFQESLAGAVSIRAFGWVETFKEQNLRLLDESQRPYYTMFCIQRWLQVALDLLVAGLVTLLVGIAVAVRGKGNTGFIGTGLVSVTSLNYALADFIQAWTNLENSIGAISRLRSFVAETDPENKHAENSKAPAAWPSAGIVSIRDFDASYADGSDLVLRGVNLQVKAGEKIGICGRSGSGKSSLLASFLHLLEYRGGAIVIDNVDLASLTRETLRQHINVIPQEPYFIKGTFRMNINPWTMYGEKNDASFEHNNDETVSQVLKLVKLWDTIQAKGGLDAEMESDFLSHGQRQLFCLARALLRNKSKLVILDEITSSVDIQTEELMQNIVRESFSDCTVIAVAHRLKTIIDFDRIAVLSAGRIIECDSPANLLGRPSAFRELYES